MSEIDFTNCPHLTTRAYGGANGKKIAVEFEGSAWFLKFPPSAAEKPNELSYSNSAYSEHLGSMIFRLLGVEAQETRLGTRHNGNWGFLADDVSGRVSLAPVFDCGSCLLPQADEAIMRKVLSNEAELKSRIYTFPASMLKQGGMKIAYCEFIRTSDDPNFRRSLQKLLPRIHALDVEALIADTPYLTALQRDFLTVYLNARRRELFGGAR